MGTVFGIAARSRGATSPSRRVSVSPFMGGIAAGLKRKRPQGVVSTALGPFE
jgi:hypothetical protein